jgi:phage shock protein A
MVRGMSTSSAMAAFERMEEKVLMQEARAQAGAELAGADLETQFAQLESSDVDYELAELKRQMLPPAAAPNQPQTPPQKDSSAAKSHDVVDADLEALKRQLDQM